MKPGHQGWDARDVRDVRDIKSRNRGKRPGARVPERTWALVEARTSERARVPRGPGRRGAKVVKGPER